MNICDLSWKQLNAHDISFASSRFGWFSTDFMPRKRTMRRGSDAGDDTVATTATSDPIASTLGDFDPRNWQPDEVRL